MKMKLLCVLMLMSAICFAQIPTTNLKGAYKFNNGSLAGSYSTPALTLNSGSKANVPDRFSSANDAIKVNNSKLSRNGINISNQLALSFWVKTTNNIAPNLKKNIFYKKNVYGYEVYMRYGKVYFTGTLKIHYLNGTSAYKTFTYATPVINDGNWHHIVINTNMTSTPSTGVTNQYVDIYTDLNKQSYLYQDMVGGPYGGAQGTNQATGLFEISKYLGNGSANDPFAPMWLYQDNLDDIYLYNDYLTDAEVEALAKDGGFCFPPKLNDLTATATETSITASWVDSGTYDIAYVLKGQPFANATQVNNLAVTSYTISGLNSNTEYDVYVRKECSTTLESNWAKKTFKTLATQRALTTNSTNGSVSTNPTSSTGSFDDGTSVELTATPDTGYEFTGWSGDATGTTNPVTIVMDADKTVTANFSLLQHTITVNATNGSVTINPTAVNNIYDYGTVLTLTPNPDANYQFVEWTGDATGTDNPLSITVDSDKTITAVFSSTLNVKDEKLAKFKMYPNPVGNMLYITSEQKLDKLEIYSLLGQKVLTTESKKINVSSLSQGMYLLKIYHQNGSVTTKKFVKE